MQYTLVNSLTQFSQSVACSHMYAVSMCVCISSKRYITMLTFDCAIEIYRTRIEVLRSAFQRWITNDVVVVANPLCVCIKMLWSAYDKCKLKQRKRTMEKQTHERAQTATAARQSLLVRVHGKIELQNKCASMPIWERPRKRTEKKWIGKRVKRISN